MKDRWKKNNFKLFKGVIFLSLGVVFFIDFCHSSEKKILSLSDYLSQVKVQHQGILGLEETSSGAELRSKEGSLLLSPTIFTNAQVNFDEKPNFSVATQGNKTTMGNFTFGVSQQTNFGLQAKLYYNLGHYSVEGVNPALVPMRNYYDTRPTLELTQSLWRNMFGSEVKKSQELMEAQALATSFAENFKIKMILYQAEAYYWRLVLAREVIEMQVDGLTRAERIKEWSGRRSRLQLSDRSDYLQAETAVKARQLELQMAVNEEKAASRSFNTMRYVTEENVNEKLQNLDAKMVGEVMAPARVEVREDIKAAIQMKRLAESSADVALEKNRPTLEVFLNHSWNGRDREFLGAVGDSLTPENPTSVVGVRYNFPLDREIIARNRAGYMKDKAGAEYAFRQKLFEQDREWMDLNRRLAEAKERFQMARVYEMKQKEKLDYERDRFGRGRTTTYQVILFEQDYATSQLARIKVQADIFGILAQMKTFGGRE